MSDRRLVLTWTLLMGLTFVTGLASAMLDAHRLGALWLAVLALVTIVKGRLILARYLRLEQAPGFLGGFTASIVVVMMVVTLSVMAIREPLLIKRPAAASPATAHSPLR
ncbi:MAG: hypothetical protein LWW93_12665 [Hyphomicrobiales bacterium]|nr:hypothetical protein [Hyphomicrobiales bacterium]